MANESGSAGWDYPSAKMLQDLFKDRRPILKIQGLQIKHPESAAMMNKRVPKHDRREVDEVDWLPRPDSNLQLPCIVQVSMADPSSPKNKLYVDSRRAKIRQYVDRNDSSHFNVELKSPFWIEFEKMFTVVAEGKTGYRFKRTIVSQYTMDVVIQCLDSDGAAELLAALEGKDASAYGTLPANEGVLKATWDRLPNCPTSNDTVTIQRMKGHKGNKPLDPEYKLEIVMGWSRRQDTPLEEYNKSLVRVKAALHPLYLPTLPDIKSQHEVTYQWKNGSEIRHTTVKGLVCPICEREQPTLLRLRLHCLLSHDQMEFRAATPDKPGLAIRTKHTQHKVWVEQLRNKLEKQHISGPEDVKINWTAPDRAFDISAQLDGKDDWMSDGRSKTKDKRGRHPMSKQNSSLTTTGPPRVRKRPALDDVKDLPQQSRKRRKVPLVPDRRFYHNKSKEVIEPGTYVSDSEDEYGIDGIAEGQKNEMRKIGLDETKIAFHAALNAHLQSEKSDSVLLVRDALVRFARQKKIRENGWLDLFEETLKLYAGQKIINQDLIQHCMGLAGYAGLNGEEDVGHDTNGGGPSRKRMKWHGGGITSLGGSQSKLPNGRPASPSDSGPGSLSPPPPTDRIKGRCTCGKSAFAERAAISCACVGCVRQYYHLACVGLEKRKLAWLCADCLEDMPPAQLT